jgi:uncharacterized protein (UPF0333 family)
MKASSIIAIVIAGVLGFALIGSYVSYANYGNRTERQLVAKNDDNQNIYANGSQKIFEIAQVPAMYKNDVKEVFTAAINGRYGEKGSQAMFQMLKEQNPQLDPSMYIKIQQVMEQFRNEFQQGQKEMLDMRRSYETALGNVWGGTWLSIAGYPKVNMKDFAIVTTDKAAETFKTKRDTGIQLQQSK